jgi:hypothetical protein
MTNNPYLDDSGARHGPVRDRAGSTPPVLAPASPDQTPEPPDGRSGRARRWGTVVAGIGAAVVVVGGAFFGAQALGSHSSSPSSTSAGTRAPAASPAGHLGQGTSGTVRSINATGLTLTDQSGAVINVTISPSTTISKTTAGSLSDVKAGDHVIVVASGTSPTLTATRITDSGNQAATAPAGGGSGAGAANQAVPGAAAGGAGSVAQGTISSISGSTITVSESNGTAVPVAVNASTAVSVTRPEPLSGIAAGDTVWVRGTTSGTSVAATSIADGVSSFGQSGQAPNSGGQARTSG